jgi:hypothetical protein
MITFGIVGTGWRSEFFLRVVKACPQYFMVAGLVGRSAEKATELGLRFDAPVAASVDELITSARPQFVVVSVSSRAALPIVTRLAEAGMPILLETPAAETLDGLRALWALVERGAKIQVAEQYWAQPHHAARLTFAHSGKLGKVTQAQVSAAHGYHGVSLIRRFLGVGFEPVSVSAASFTSPLVRGPDRHGLPKEESVAPSQQVTARLDFGDKLGIYDFTGDQYFSLIRGQRLLVRGERGEIIDESAVYLADYRTPVRLSFVRHSAGINGNLEGNYLKGIQAGEAWLYRNPLAPAALPDDEIAVGTCLLRMGEYVSEGTPFYGAAEACQDRYIDLMMQEAVQTGTVVRSQRQPWHGA